jgi:glycosyltransferase involved in cell wall biosynthesis
MRILHVIRSLDPHCGGPPAVLRELVPRQLQRGSEVTILATTEQAAGQIQKLPRAAFCDAMRADPVLTGAQIHLIRAYGRKKPWATFAYAPSSRQWLQRRLADPAQRPDVVHIHEVFVHLNASAARQAWQHGVPYGFAPYGCLDSGPLRMGSASLKRAFLGLVCKKAIRRAAFVQATSQFETEELPDWVPRELVRLVPHGVNMPQGDPQAAIARFHEQFPQTRNRRLLVSMARIHPIKRLHLAIDALAILRGSHPDLMLAIAGRDAGAAADLQRQIARLGLQDAVLFVGFADGQLKEGLFAAASLFVLPSSHENFGLVVLEAMARGLPAVVTAEVASRVYVDDSGCGMTVAGTPQALADAIRAVLNDHDPARGEQAKQYIRQNLSWDAVVEQTDSLYREAVSRAHHNVAR